MTPPSARLACFGGVYGNRHALEAVLADAQSRGLDRVWCLGDLGGFGPDPEGCADLLRRTGVPTVQGNYDHSIGHHLDDCACGYTDPRDYRFARIAFAFTDARVSEVSRALKRDQPREARVELAGRRVLLCHGSPRRQNEFLWDSTCSDAFLVRLLHEHEADAIVCTHTGLQWARPLPGGRLVVNCGAIGRPAHDGRTHGWYAEVSDGADGLTAVFHPVVHDHEAVARDMESAGLPPEFVETTRTGWWT
ncbi:MAG: metallophosphoesterase family protein, partial [bacterium]